MVLLVLWWVEVPGLNAVREVCKLVGFRFLQQIALIMHVLSSSAERFFDSVERDLSEAALEFCEVVSHVQLYVPSNVPLSIRAMSSYVTLSHCCNGELRGKLLCQRCGEGLIAFSSNRRSAECPKFQ